MFEDKRRGAETPRGDTAYHTEETGLGESLCLSALGAPSREDLIALGRARAVECRAALESAGLEAGIVALGGSLISGLYFGERSFSKLFEREPDGRRLEIDLEVTLIGRDPCSAETVSSLERAFPGARVVGREMDMWNGKERMTAVIWEEALPCGTCLEWDLLVTKEPYVSLAATMPVVFSPDEIAWHRELRRFAARRSVDAYDEVKSLQILEVRWRVAASYSLSEIARMSDEIARIIPELPLTGAPPPPVDGAVTRWLAGEEGNMGVHRPALIGSFEVHRDFLRETGLERPRDPAWIEPAQRVQWLLQSRRLERERVSTESKDDTRTAS